VSFWTTLQRGLRANAAALLAAVGLPVVVSAAQRAAGVDPVTALKDE
jgi:hypothetical protein